MRKLIKQFFVLTLAALCCQSFFILAPLPLAAPKAMAQTQPSLTSYYADSDVPVILPRSTWDNTSSLNALLTWLPQVQNGDKPSDWQPVERIVIHDTGCDPTANPACNKNTDPIATIQAIYRYHAVTRGWGDIGYNYIIDQQGRIYEARFGGNGSRGAHLYVDCTEDNFNYGSIGISILGNYATWQPPEAVYASLTRLVGWLAAVNGLDTLGNSSSFVWNLGKKGFQTYYTGSTVLGHKDIELGNPDPKLLDFARLRQESSIFAAKFKTYIYQKSSEAQFYSILKGARKAYNSLNDLSAQGISYSKIVSLPAKQLDLFSETRFLKYPDGSLVQIKNDSVVYLIEGGKKRAFDLTANQFLKLGFDFKKVKQVTADEMANYPAGLQIKYGSDGQLLSDGAKVYLIENGRKRWVTTGNLFNKLGYKWTKVKADATLAGNLLDGLAMVYPDGTLIREASGAAVYLMKDGEKHEFVSAQTFLKLGYKWEKIVSVEPIEILLCPTGPIVTYADGTLVRGENSQDIYLIQKGAAKQFISAEIFLNLGYKWSSVLVIPDGEMARYSAGEPVKYADKTLLRPNDRNTVYLISNGQPTAVDAATFKKKNYKWSNVKVIASRDFGILYEGKAMATSTPSPLPTPSVSPSPSLTPSPTPTPSPLPTPSPSSGTSALGPKIKVKIFEVTGASVTLSADGVYDIFDKSGQVIATKNAGENYSYSLPSSVSAAYVKITPRSPSGIVEVISYNDHPAWKPALNYNKFRGSFEIIYSSRSAKILGVNELYLEDYLKGVAETSQGLNMEYLKTMTVAARTYAYHYQQLGGKYGAQEVYHITNTTADQLYKGYGREPYASDIITAVVATAGEMAIYNNQPIVTAYSSGAPELIASGSKSACSVWGGKYCQAGYEYLVGGVKDPAGTNYSLDACGVSGNHCVGLSGAGTRQLAANGKTYKEILTYYYSGITVGKIY